MKLWTVSYTYDNDPVCHAIFDTEQAAIDYAMDPDTAGDEVHSWRLNQPESGIEVGYVYRGAAGSQYGSVCEFKHAT